MVILLLSLSCETVNQGTAILVYSCKENSWTEPQSVPFFVPNYENCRFVLNGVPHWEGRTNTEDISAVFSFDPTTKSHKLIPYPVNNSHRNVFLVKVRDDIVALAHSDTNDTWDAYFYESECWVKKYTTGPLVSIIVDIQIVQFFEGAIVTWGLLSDTTDFHDVSRNILLPISDMITRLHPKMSQSYSHVKTLLGVPGGQPFYPRSMRDVIKDFECRRTGLIRALTTDIEELYRKCDLGVAPGEEAKGPISLYGLPNNEWIIEKRPRLDNRNPRVWVEILRRPPKPTCGINFARKKMEEYDWLSFVAKCSDDWLIFVAHFYAVQYGFNQADRQRVFTQIHDDLPTLYDIVMGAKEKVTKQVPAPIKRPRSLQFKDDDEEGLKAVVNRHGDAIICEACGESSGHDEFAICCDRCQKIFYQKCVKITTPRVEHVEQNICSSCIQ